MQEGYGLYSAHSQQPFCQASLLEHVPLSPYSNRMVCNVPTTKKRILHFRFAWGGMPTWRDQEKPHTEIISSSRHRQAVHVTRTAKNAVGVATLAAQADKS